MSVKCIPPKPHHLYRKTRICMGMPIFLGEVVLTCTQINVLSKIIKDIKNFPMKFSIFAFEKFSIFSWANFRNVSFLSSRQFTTSNHIHEMYSRHIPLLYSKTGVYRGIYFLIFDAKLTRRYWALGEEVLTCLNLNSLLVTRKMTLFHQGVWMREKLVVKRTWTHSHQTFQQRR